MSFASPSLRVALSHIALGLSAFWLGNILRSGKILRSGNLLRSGQSNSRQNGWRESLARRLYRRWRFVPMHMTQHVVPCVFVDLQNENPSVDTAPLGAFMVIAVPDRHVSSRILVGDRITKIQSADGMYEWDGF